MMVLYRLTTSYFVCGVLVNQNGIIAKTAPIVGWSKGKSIKFLTDWIEKKGGTWEIL